MYAHINHRFPIFLPHENYTRCTVSHPITNQWRRKIFCKGGLIVVWPRPPQLCILERGWNSRLYRLTDIIISAVDHHFALLTFET